MNFNPTIAAIRFGDGLARDSAPPADMAALLAQITGPDLAVTRYPIKGFAALTPDFEEIAALQTTFRRNRQSAEAEDLRRAYRHRLKAFNRDRARALAVVIARGLAGPDPLRERLTRFWGDHFTAIGRRGWLRFAAPAYIEDAIRPYVSGRFADMLKAAVTHPLMLRYLDQDRSVGPNAPARRGRRGINENLAREVLELHTLGVGGPYSQTDVRQLAELFTGLSVAPGERFVFRPKLAEPGPESVLGRSYGTRDAALSDIFEVLDDLARHERTAQHIAQKLAVHFVADDPDPGLVDAVARAYLDSDGDLPRTYAVLLAHPASWAGFGAKVKPPLDFVISAYRALGVPVRVIQKARRNQLQTHLVAPLTAMGQPPFRPGGPDGWPEAAEAWITPQGLAARLQWAMAMPSVIFRSLPDPREFAQTAMGPLVDPAMRFAAEAAETRRDGVGLILAAPGFQRR